MNFAAVGGEWLRIIYVIMNANSCVDSILCKLYITWYETAVQTRMFDIS